MSFSCYTTTLDTAKWSMSQNDGWKLGCEEGLRRCWPNAQHCTCTKKETRGKRCEIERGGGVDKDWLLGQCKDTTARHWRRGEQSRNWIFTTLGLYSSYQGFSLTTGTQTSSCQIRWIAHCSMFLSYIPIWNPEKSTTQFKTVLPQ